MKTALSHVKIDALPSVALLGSCTTTMEDEVSEETTAAMAVAAEAKSAAAAAAAAAANAACIEWVRDRMLQLGISPGQWRTEHDQITSEWLTSPASRCGWTRCFPAVQAMQQPHCPAVSRLSSCRMAQRQCKGMRSSFFCCKHGVRWSQ
eukprot:410566-Pleurochrysis_carterae.AAC.3